MKKFLKFSALLCLLPLFSLDITKKVHGSAVGFFGGSFGWQNIQHHATSDFDTAVLLGEKSFEEAPKGSVILDPPNPDAVSFAQPVNQYMTTQNFQNMTAVYPTSRPSGEIFAGGEFRDNGFIFQAQIGLNFVGSQGQQRFTYDVIKQSIVKNIIDQTINSHGEAPSVKPNGGLDSPLIHNIDYNGVQKTTGSFTIKTNIGVKALFGFGLHQNDLALVFNVGYAGEHNTAYLNYNTGPLAFNEDGGDNLEDNTSVKKLWRHGVLLGLQFIWSLHRSVDALIFWQKTFYQNEVIDFISDLTAKGQNQNSEIHNYNTEFLYNYGTSPSGNRDANNILKNGRLQTEIGTGNTAKITSHLENTYIGFGFRFKIGGEDE